jgi:hypothetical protein
MKAFLWLGLDRVSDRFHSGGSILVVAENIERAREISFFETSTFNIENDLYEEKKIKIDTPEKPDAIFESDLTEEKIWIFINAGCC